MRTPTVTHILSVQHWHLRHKTFVQWSRMEKKKYLFSFFRFYKFLIIKFACISKSWFFKKTLSFVYNFCTTCMDRNHLSKFYFWPTFLLGFSILVFRWEIHPEKRCSIRRCFYTILHSFSILCKDLQKVSDVSAKIKKRIHDWWCCTVYNFVHFSHENLHIFLMNFSFIFSPVISVDILNWFVSVC